MSRLSGLPSSYWDDESPSAAGEEWDEELYEENEASSEGNEELDEEDDSSFAAAKQDDAEHRAHVYSHVFMPNLTNRAAAIQARAKKSSRAIDLTHTFFAALELDRTVFDVEEEMLSNVAQAEHLAASQAVRFVVDRLVSAVQLEAISGKRQQQYDIHTQRKPMCAKPQNPFSFFRESP
jgi:hypothetical protein